MAGHFSAHTAGMYSVAGDARLLSLQSTAILFNNTVINTIIITIMLLQSYIYIYI